MKNLNNLNVTPFTNEEVLKLTRLYQFKGKDFFYETIMKPDLERIMRRTVEDECYEFVKYVGLNLTDNRKNLIIRKDATPKTADEQLLANLKNVLTRFMADPKSFELITNEVNSMAKLLYHGLKDINFNSRTVDVQINLITDKKKVSSRNELDELLKKYESLTYSNSYEKTYLITNFYIDFTHMNIFNEGNDLIGLILFYILITREGFSLFRYVSFFKLLNVHKDEFKIAYLTSGYNYEEGFSKSAPIQKLLIDMMLEGYNSIERIVENYDFDKNINKTDDIEITIYKLPQVFTKDDIRIHHPLVSESTINRTLNRLKNENIVRPNGVGRSATWVRLVDRDKFNPDIKQINLFEVGVDEE